MSSVDMQSATEIDGSAERFRRILAIHFDSDSGTPFWLDRAKSLGIEVFRDVHTLGDMALFGEMTPADLRSRPITDYIPRRFHPSLSEFVLGQTGGTTGVGTWTAYREDEFHQAFVEPFAVAASHIGFPHGEQWLYIGPSGPHIIGKAASCLARATGSGDPFSVDFDARWAKKLPEGSFAHDRYTQHVVDQAMDVIRIQRIGVLFSTPIVLVQLAALMTAEQRESIRGVHYGGMALSSQQLERFQIELFPNAVHLSGYGNTLFGCCLELNCWPGRPLDYYPFGHRLILEVVDDQGQLSPEGEIGTVRFTRLDESMLLIRMRERDRASAIGTPASSPVGYSSPGVRNPGVDVSATPTLSIGLY